MNYKIMSDFEYIDIVRDIINNEEFLKLKFYRHHDNTRLDHCLKVSYNAYKLAKKFNLDYKAAARCPPQYGFFDIGDEYPYRYGTMANGYRVFCTQAD